jgi:hypothetical protein
VCLLVPRTESPDPSVASAPLVRAAQIRLRQE